MAITHLSALRAPRRATPRKSSPLLKSLLPLLCIALLAVLLAPASVLADSSSAYGQIESFGGFDQSAYANGNYNGTLTEGKFLDVKGFAVDIQDSTGGPHDTALYVVDRTSSDLGTTTSWRIQKLSETGTVLATTTFTLPNTHFTAASIAGLAVDHAAGRLYALVIGQPVSGLVPVAQEVLAWSTTPSSKQLVAASGLASDPLGSTGGLISSQSQLQPGGGTPLYGPEGIVVDPDNTGGATDPVAIEASELSPQVGKGAPVPGDTIVQQVATSPQTGKLTGDLLGSWTDASVPGAEELDHYGPAGISLAPDGTLTVLLEGGTSAAANVNALKLNADLSSPTALSDAADQPPLLDFDEAPFYMDVPPFSTLSGIGVSLSTGAGAPLVRLSTAGSSNTGGLYAAVFQPSHDNHDNQFPGEPVPYYWHDGGVDESPPWSANIGVRLLAANGSGAISDQHGGTIVNTLGASSGACGINAPYASLAAGANGALWVIDSGEETVNGGSTATGGRQIVELEPAAGSLCPQPSGTFTAAVEGHSGQPGAPVTVPVGATVTFDASNNSGTAGGMNWQGSVPFAFEWDLNGNHSDGPNSDGYETINQIASPSYGFPSSKATFKYETPGEYEVRLKFIGDYGVYTTTGTVKVVPAVPPAAAFSVSPNPLAGQAVSFDASASSAGFGTIASYTWQWGDGSSPEEDSGELGSVFTHTYSAAGTYTVKLTVTSSLGLTASTENSVTVTTGGGQITTTTTATATTSSSTPPPPPPPVVNPKASAAGTTAKVTLACPANEASCAGTVQIKTVSAYAATAAAVTADATAAKAKKGKPKKPKASQLVLGQTSFSLLGGQSKTLTVNLSAQGLALLKKLGHVNVLVIVAAHNQLGASTTETTRLTLKAPPAKKSHKRH